MRIFTSLIIFLVFVFNTLSAQEIEEDYKTPEAGFALMREHAEEHQYNKAKSIGQKILSEDPDYFDVALYLARIYGWEARYDSAYLILEDIISKEPDLFEAHETFVDLAYWENDWEKLETYAARALELKPDAATIKEKYLLAKFQQNSKQDQPELFLHYYYDHFGLPYARNWHMLTVGAILPLKMGILSPYLNGGYQSGVQKPSTDFQLNLDAYLNLGKKNYALAGYGFSPEGVVDYLPRHRVAAEIWQALPRGYALSVGLRYFYWTQHFTFMTFSEEKYAGNYLFTFRSYLFFKDYGVSGSYYLSTRRYFKDKFNHLTLTLGYGTAPDEPILVVSDLDRLKAYTGRLEFSKQIRHNLRLNVMTGYAYEAYVENEYRHRIDLRAGFYIRLRK
jgi:YaiO family outer membrane protein